MPGNVRDLTRVLEAAGLDVPANVVRSQEQLFLNYQIVDLERLGSPIPHPHAARRFNMAASGNAFYFAAARLIAGPRGARVTLVVNYDATNAIRFGVQQDFVAPLVAWTPVTPNSTWGQPVRGVIEQGTTLLGAVGVPFFLADRGDTHTESDSPIPLYPGDILYVHSVPANVAADFGIAWDEPL